jgi:hypothetical protein
MSEVLDTIEGIATDAGFEPERHQDSIIIKYKLPGGREQTVFVAESGQSPGGMTVISFVSPCQRLKAGFLGGMSKAQALDLLRRNARLPFAAFTLLSSDGGEVVCVRGTQLLETMDLPEFAASCECVATFADRYEAEQGRDDF